MVFSQRHYNQMLEESISSNSKLFHELNDTLLTTQAEWNQCSTMFEDNHQCQGIEGHSGCCQDIDYDGANGDQYTYPNGKNWSKRNE